MEGFAPYANSLELAVTTRALRPSPLEFRRDGTDGGFGRGIFGIRAKLAADAARRNGIDEG